MKSNQVKTDQVIQTGDEVKETVSADIETDKLLAAIGILYVSRCKALQEGNIIAVELFNHQIADLKTKLAQI